MVINVSSVQYIGGFLPDIILLTQCYHHRRTRLDAMKRFLSLQPMIPPKRFDIFYPLTGGCSEAFRFFFKHTLILIGTCRQILNGALVDYFYRFIV